MSSGGIRWILVAKTVVSLVVVSVMGGVAEVVEAILQIPRYFVLTASAWGGVVVRRLFGAPAQGVAAAWSSGGGSLSLFGVLAPLFGLALFLVGGYLLMREVKLLVG